MWYLFYHRSTSFFLTSIQYSIVWLYHSLLVNRNLNNFQFLNFTKYIAISIFIQASLYLCISVESSLRSKTSGSQDKHFFILIEPTKLPSKKAISIFSTKKWQFPNPCQTYIESIFFYYFFCHSIGEVVSYCFEFAWLNCVPSPNS